MEGPEFEFSFLGPKSKYSTEPLQFEFKLMQIHRDKRRRYCEIVVCVLINTYISKYTSWECVIHVVKIRFKPFHEKVLLKAFLQLRHWEYFKKCQPTWLVEEKCQRNWLVEEKCHPTWLVAKNAFSLVCDDMSNMSSIHCVNLSASGAFLVCIIIIVIIIIIIIIYLFTIDKNVLHSFRQS